MTGKYVIFERYDELEYPVLFPNTFIKHEDVKGDGKPVRAGFFSISGDDLNGWKVSTWGKSISLGLNSDEKDGKMICHALTHPM